LIPHKFISLPQRLRKAGRILAAVVVFRGSWLQFLQHRHPLREITLIESDQRKAVFLRQAVRELGLRCTVLCRRIEQISDFRADVVSARALAPLAQLLALAAPLLGTDGTCLFSKGAGRQQEIDEARQAWRFTLVETVSVTDSSAAILKITDMHHV